MGRGRAGVGRFWRRRFPVLTNNPGETEAYRRRFQTAVSLLLGYRALGSLTAFAAFSSRAHVLASRPERVAALSIVYATVAVIACWATANVKIAVPAAWVPFRRDRAGALQVAVGWEQGGWLNRRICFEADLVVTVVLNLVLAASLRRGVVYEQQADVFGVAFITTTVLWTARRGGLRGLLVLPVVALTEVAKGPVNGMPWHDVEGTVILARLGWAVCGWIVGLGVVRILLDYAERSERLRIEEEQLLVMSKSHDTYKAALVRIADILGPGSSAGSTEDAIGFVRSLAVEATHDTDGRHLPDTIRAVVDEAAQRGRAVNPNMHFEVVDATHGSLAVTRPDLLGTVVTNLTCNAARHSQGTRTTIRCLPDHVNGTVTITVVDNGVGMALDATSAGIGLARSATVQLCGDMYREPVEVGTKWVVVIGEPAVKEFTP